MTKRFAALLAAIGLLAVAAFPAAARNAHANNSYTLNNLVPDSTDATLVNGWDPNVPASTMTSTGTGVVATSADAIYKGLAIGSVGTANYLYAADFPHGRVDVYDGSFAPATLAGNFTDPGLPAGYAPFGI